MLIANIEGDELLMETVTSIRKQDYLIKFKSGATLKNEKRHNKRKLINQLQRIGKIEKEDYDLELVYEYKPISLALFIIERQLKKIQHVTECDVCNIWLGPDDGSNFRYKSAVTQKYKNNRLLKPDILLQLRQYLINLKGAQVIYGYEADDALGIHQKALNETDSMWQDVETIAVHCDKDIFMIPGLHYNTKTDLFVNVDELGSLVLKEGKVKGTGTAFFYYQLLVGDPTDTIPNMCKGFGATRAYKILEGCVCEADYLQSVISTYQEYVTGCSYIDRLLEQADLVWICRDRKETGRDYIARRHLELFGREL